MTNVSAYKHSTYWKMCYNENRKWVRKVSILEKGKCQKKFLIRFTATVWNSVFFRCTPWLVRLSLIIQLKHKTIHISEIGVSFFSWKIIALDWVETLHTYTLVKTEQTYQGCSVNKHIVCTVQHDDQVIWHTTHGCWDSHISFMSPPIPHLLKSCGC